jgi:hypothetical protein
MNIFKRILTSRIAGMAWMGAGLFVVLSFQGAGLSWAGNKLINVQGKLTDSNGNALGGSFVVTFRFYANVNDSMANAVWTESQQITVQNGLINATLGNVNSLDSLSFNTPYYLGMQVAGDNNELTPRQLLGASAYALGSLGDFNVAQNLSVNGNAVVNGNISVGGTDVKSYLVPPGAIMMFAGGCPGGWTRFTALDGRFPQGSDTYGNTGGSPTHSHTVNSHTHSVSGTTSNASLTGSITTYNGNFQVTDGQCEIGLGSQASLFPPTSSSQHNHNMSLTSGPPSDRGTDSQSNIPPYLNVVWCRKN